jgi:4'-phosphopantetheinyl transferase
MTCARLSAECDKLSVAHVCVFSVMRCGDRFAQLAEWLSPEERARADRFLKEADQKRFILGRASVRCLGGAYLGIEPARVQLDQASAGKPYIANPVPANRDRFEFNVAHSGDCVLVAWTRAKAVGADVEALERSTPALFGDALDGIFSDAERVALCAAKQDEVAATFYRIWVRKEAVLKAEGCGIGGLSPSLSVIHRHASRTEWLDEVEYPESGRRWRIVDFIPAPDHIAALALPPGTILRQSRPDEIGSLSCTLVEAIQGGAKFLDRIL